MGISEFSLDLGFGLPASPNETLSKCVRFPENPVTMCWPCSPTDFSCSHTASPGDFDVQTHGTMCSLALDGDEPLRRFFSNMPGSGYSSPCRPVSSNGDGMKQVKLFDCNKASRLRCGLYSPMEQAMVNGNERPPLDCAGSERRYGQVYGTRRRNNINNNFWVDIPKNRKKPLTWADEKVYDRTETLALPKPTPKGYQEEKEATYWISKKPPPVPKAGFTQSVATARVEQLAKPLYDRGEWKGIRHCLWEEDYDHQKKSNADPEEVDWDRLAMPKNRKEPCFNNPIRQVSKSALQFETTKRLFQLAIPKMHVDSGSYYLWLWNRQPNTKAKLTEVKQLCVDRTDMNDARVLLRCDLDCTEGKPIEAKVEDILPTIEYAFKKKARAVIIVSHCGHPNGKKVPELSLERLTPLLDQALPDNNLVFMDNCIGAEAIALCEDPEPGKVFLLENLRFHPEEEGFYLDQDGKRVACTKEKIKKFREIMNNYYDVYINEAFTLLHTDATTIFGDPSKDRCYGFHIKRQLSVYNQFLVKTNGKRLVAVVGGAYDDVADIVYSLMGKAQELLLGGEIGTMFLHAVKGVEIGETECSPYHQRKIKDMMSRARDTHTVVGLPSDLVVEHVNQPGHYFTGYSKEGVDDYYQVVDIGPLTRECFRAVMLTADHLIWIGQMGCLQDGSKATAMTFSEATRRGIRTYLVDDNTLAWFRYMMPAGCVSYVTENSYLTSMLVHRKVPKGLTSLTPARRHTKKRPPRPVWVSDKPTNYDLPCMRMCDALDHLAIDTLDLKDKRVVIRSDLNVLIVDGQIKDDYRLRMSIPSIRYALQCGAWAVVVVGSLGDQHGKRVDTLSLRPVAEAMAALLNITAKAVRFVAEPTLARVQGFLRDCHPGTVLVLENINFRPEEMAFTHDLKSQGQKDVEKVANFCAELTRYGDVYINDTFSTLHHATASVCGSMHQQRAYGFLLRNELRYLSQVFNAPPRPFLVILGGHYSKGKLSGLKSLMIEIDELIITGSLAITFLKVIHEMPTGASFIHPELEAEVPNILSIASANQVKVIYPVDFVVASSIEERADVKQMSASVGIPDQWYGVDIGNKSCSLFRQAIRRNKLILWHGVAGVVECKKFATGSRELLDNISAVTLDPEARVVSVVAGQSSQHFARSTNSNLAGLSHVTTGGVANLALIKDKCLKPVHKLSASSKSQSLSKLTLDNVEVANMAVLVRAYLDVGTHPSDDTAMLDTSSIRQLVPTIKYLQRKGARAITVVGSRGNPQGQRDPQLSLLTAKVELEKQLRQEVAFFSDGLGLDAENWAMSASGGAVCVLENLRFHPQEQGWTEDAMGELYRMPHSTIQAYRDRMGRLGEIYVNESLASLSCCDSSVVAVPAKARVFGQQLKYEISKLRTYVERLGLPFMAIVGSHHSLHQEEEAARLEMILDLLDGVTDLILVGDLATTYLRVLNPQAKLGNTPFDAEQAKVWPRILNKAKLNGIRLHSPIDFQIDEKVEAPPDEAEANMVPPTPPEAGDDGVVPEERVLYVPVVKTLKDGVSKAHRVMDIGPQSVEKFREVILTASSILLMGPAGHFNEEDYDYGSRGVVLAIQEAVKETDAQCLACGVDTYQMLQAMDEADRDGLGLACLETSTCVSLIRRAYLPGLDALSPAPPKALKKLSVDTFNLSGHKALLRLDLDIPVVGEVILDVTKLEAALPTIRYLLENEVRYLVLMGHRGNPNGFHNRYLSLEPLAREFAIRLEMSVNFLPYPCSAKTRELLEEAEEGSVFLMENLRFYPAEDGAGSKQQAVEDVLEDAAPVEESLAGTEEEAKSEMAASFAIPEDEQEGEEGEEEAEGNGLEEEEKEDAALEEESLDDGDANDEFVEFEDDENLDRPMFEKMAPKSVRRYIRELSACGDVFINDDVSDIGVPLTSVTELTCAKKMCGLQLASFLAQSERPEMYQVPGVAVLSPAPKPGEKDSL